MSKGKARMWLLLVLIALALFANLPSDRFSINGSRVVNWFSNLFDVSESCEEGTLCVTFFNVGQGDALLIESPTGVQVLIDGGPDSSVLRSLGRRLGYFDRSLDMVVATHEDKDHVGGLPYVFNRYEVATFLRTENQGESLEANTIDSLSKKEGSEIVFARRSMRYDLGGGVHMDVLFPDRDPSMLESNTSSIVVRVSYGDTAFLLTGDAPSSIEDHLVVLSEVESSTLKSTVLKAGHHGSRTSTSALFLEAVKPEYVVVSSGKDNRYGHPHSEVIERISKTNALILKTEDGEIRFRSDGKSVSNH